MSDEDGEIFKNKIALVKILAKKVSEEKVVVQCPMCGDPAKKVDADDLDVKEVRDICDPCKGRLYLY